MKYLFTTLLLLVSFGVSAQQIEGRVVGSDNEPLLGASVYWAGTTVGVTTDSEGRFATHRIKNYDRLVASYVGFANDTIAVNAATNIYDFVLSEGVAVESVTVEGVVQGNFISAEGMVKSEVISFAGLCKMACCSLAESFENSAAVTVGYSDAISGARQIKMLGLAGTYTQLLDQSRPIMSGLAAPYSLSYTPGMWLNSIQVSKGVASVTSGSNAITGQINLSHRKPTDEERLFVNGYIDNELRTELNVTSALPVAADGRLSTVILAHGSTDNDVVEMDHNGDGFRDMPHAKQLNLANRWLYAADNGAQLRWGFKVLQDERLGGDVDYDPADHDDMFVGWGNDQNIYGSQITNRLANGYVKFGMPVGKAVYNADEGDEMRSNVAFVADFEHFDEDAYFGVNDYLGSENSFSFNAMYNHYFNYSSSFILGLTAHSQNINESLVNPTRDGVQSYRLDRDERQLGLYGEYTYSLKDKFSIIAGMRGDYHHMYDKVYFTPRGQVKWNATRSTVLRGSAGMGYRSTNIITDNIGMLATGRQIIFRDGFGESGDPLLDRMERALTYGASLTQTFGIINSGDATVSVDYFRTQFFNQVVVDQEYDSRSVMLYSSDQRSFTDTYQFDFSWHPITRFDIFATFRYTNSLMTLDRADGSTVEVERPLVSRYKGLLNLQYATNMRRWTFDATAQINGPMRLPTLSGDLADSELSPIYPMFFAQVSRKVGRFDIYAGCENIANYRQEVPILGADDPYSYDFNSSVVWGPLKGRKFYLGFRFNLL